MKNLYGKNNIFSLILLALLPVINGCSQDKEDMQPPSQRFDTIIGYLSVELSAVDSPGTRDDDGFDWGYENGSVSENAVKSINLYFFDSRGNVLSARNGDSLSEEFSSCLSFNPEDISTVDDVVNVEKKFSLTFLLETENGSTPGSVIAIVNPDSYISGLTITNISDLKETVSDFATNLTRSNFVMSNSGYVSGQGESVQEVCELKLSSSDFCASAQEAIKKPVALHVERVVARLDFSFDTESNDLSPVEISGRQNVFDTGVSYKPHNAADQEEKEIYVELLGWAVTSATANSRLLKSVDKTWGQSELFKGSMSWNNAAHYRSFWAVNPADPSYSWYSFNEIAGIDDGTERPDGCFEIDLESKTTSYLQENANPYATGSVRATNPEYPTKVIVAARLIDSDGEPVTVVEYDSKYYALESLYEEVADKLDLYTPSTETNGYRKIKPSDLDLETSMEHKNQTGPDSEGTYNVYFALSTDAGRLKWFIPGIIDGEEGYLPVEDPNGYIDSKVSEVKVWMEGAAYYFFIIPHFGVNETDPGFYGVVRNHIYDAKVVQITTLGTPVYNPDEVIYPEKPPTSGNSLIATIRIVQWRLAKQHFQVSW
ncbi:MAG: Mfa1 fimbrilin C-terminal domain-containing protein [Muribaculaceae bacterium]|nr:Mfa1 fimbrilin C-terminal domain-containing protein [Muribaculaceae bacterium]